jgi:hypothetical protein
MGSVDRKSPVRKTELSNSGAERSGYLMLLLLAKLTSFIGRLRVKLFFQWK